MMTYLHPSWISVVLFGAAMLFNVQYSQANTLYEQNFIHILDSIEKGKVLKLDNSDLAFVDSVIIYRETDRGYNNLSMDMYNMVEQSISSKLNILNILTIECLECKVNKVLQTDNYIQRKIRLSSTSELLDIAHVLQVSYILVWGMLVGESPIFYFRFLNSSNGSVIYTHFYHG